MRKLLCSAFLIFASSSVLAMQSAQASEQARKKTSDVQSSSVNTTADSHEYNYHPGGGWGRGGRGGWGRGPGGGWGRGPARSAVTCYARDIYGNTYYGSGYDWSSVSWQVRRSCENRSGSRCQDLGCR